MLLELSDLRKYIVKIGLLIFQNCRNSGITYCTYKQTFSLIEYINDYRLKWNITALPLPVVAALCLS